MSRGRSPLPQRNRRQGERCVSLRRTAALEAWYRQLHGQIIAGNRPMSGRAGRYVYYWAYGHLCWRAYVVPKDPRTALQLRSRAAFAAASKGLERKPFTDRGAAGRVARRRSQDQIHLHTPSGAMPVEGAVCPARRQHGFAPTVVQPAPSPSRGPLSRTLARQLG